jgi:multidrug efflux pump subunit AcrA (membrane-fusion protein)
MTAEVDVKNPQLTLIPGMYAQVTLGTAEARDANAVPPGAIDGSGDNQKLFVVDRNGIVHVRKVVTGVQSPQYIQILSGAIAGDVVITGSHSGLHDGQKVQPRLQPS